MWWPFKKKKQPSPEAVFDFISGAYGSTVHGESLPSEAYYKAVEIVDKIAASSQGIICKNECSESDKRFLIGQIKAMREIAGLGGDAVLDELPQLKESAHWSEVFRVHMIHLAACVGVLQARLGGG